MANRQHVQVIAHRGASGYLPEHTLESKALAFAMGADYLEQDVVLTRDDVPVVLHDVYLDTVTDVARVFPERHRRNGRYYAIDFTLEEIRRLRASERFDHRTGEAVFPTRFPVGEGEFRVPSLEEEIRFIQGLNQSSMREVGIYPEIKAPAFHREEGKDPSRSVIELLARYGYSGPEDEAILQCFEQAETKRLREELGTELRSVQLLGRLAWTSWESPQAEMEKHLRAIAEYAEGIGPSLSQVFGRERSSGKIRISPLVGLAHAAGLFVHAWTYRADQIPPPFESFEELHDATIEAGIDAIFTDFPDKSVQLLRNR